jgi:hypothetical protein
MNTSNIPEEEMLQRSLITLFYSNYSANCKALLQQIKNFNSSNKLPIKYVNIDNKNIRSIIIKKFDVVPAIVVLLNDEVSLYTGSNAFDWFNQIDTLDTQPSNERLRSDGPWNKAPIEKNVSLNESKKSDKKTVIEIAAEFSKVREQTIIGKN